jgi:osmotically-inducible protein OsmY
MTQRQRWAFLAAAAVVVTMGCNRDKAADAMPGTDPAITTTIQARFFGDEAIKARDVEVDTDEGVVTLSGTVESEAERARAVQLAQQVEGVTRVENEISVEPREPDTTRDASAGSPTAPVAANRPGERGDRVEVADADGTRTPAWITMKVQAQYFADDLVKGRRIDVYASRTGAVRLEGQVDSDAERRRAVEIAKSTEGVTTVADHLQLASADSAPQRTADRDARDKDTTLGDPWVTAKIESKYFLDAEVKGRKIDVTTEDGIVTLTGEVSSPSERRQAVLLAKATEGVKEVRDQLRVVTERTDTAPAARGTGSRMMAAAAPDDEWIETRIQSRFFLEEDLKEEEIEISSAAGKVTLAGAVDSPDAKETAEEIARDTSGVDQVVNRIAVETVAPAAP